MDRDLLANIRACENSRTGVERAAKRARRATAAQTRRMEDIVDLCVDSPEASSRSKEPQPYTGSDSRPGRVRTSDFRTLWGEAMPHTGPLPSTATSEEPIRWNRVRRRSSGRAARPPVDTAPVDNEVVVCGVSDHPKVQDAADCSRSVQGSMMDLRDVMPFDPLSFEAQMALQSHANRRPPTHPYPLPHSHTQFQASNPAGLQWAPHVDPHVTSHVTSHDMAPAVQDQQFSTAPAVMHHLPYRLRHHRPFEPFDMAMLHSHNRETQAAVPPHSHNSEAVPRRAAREAPGPSIDAAPLVNLRRSRRVPVHEETGRVEPRRRAVEARHSTYPHSRADDEAELRFRMQELEALEAAFVGLEGPQGDQLPPPPPGPPADWQRLRGMTEPSMLNLRQAGEGRGRRRGWGPGLAEAMMGMLGEDPLGSPFGAHPHPSPHLAGHLNAMRAAFAGMSNNRLPPHLLFSDRDFNEDDYEALLALDDTVENRKGATKDVIEAIPTVAVPAGGLSDNGDRRCPICLEDYVSGSTLRRLHCSHQFHQPCLDKWLQQKATCPICQGECRGL